MSEARILAAFYRQNPPRFCDLTKDDFVFRSGHTPNDGETQSLLQRGLIRSSEGIYYLTMRGETYVRQMVETGTLPKPQKRLTAKPQEGRA